MQLDEKWLWEKKKLACTIKQETGNPAEDALREGLREQLAALAGVSLQELLGEMKMEKKKKKDAITVDYVGEKRFKDITKRSHIFGATEIALKSLQPLESHDAKALQNINKRYVSIPKSPPRRILLDIQRERAKPFQLPDQEEVKTATTKLKKEEKRLAKQRAARMAAKEDLAKDDDLLMKGDEMNMGTMSTILPEYKGDQFGTYTDYMGGMLYLSRMAKGGVRMKKKKFVGADDERSPTNNRPEKFGTENSLDETGFSEDANIIDNATAAEELSSKLYCAAALCNWSRNPSNATRLANEGAVRAIIQLCLERVPRIMMYCAGAFRYMSEHLLLATTLIDEGVVDPISIMISNTNDEFVCGNLTVCLLNLTRVVGKEGQLVEDGIVQAFHMLLDKRPELNAACCRGLYNLTCVDSHYVLIEKVIRQLVSLSSTGAAGVKHICAAALCNLADLKQVRQRMVEENVVSILGGLARGSESRTRRVCAVILQNLAASKGCREAMVAKNCVQTAHSLSSDQDPIILRCIGLTLSKLALEPAHCNRIINDKGIIALCNIAVKFPTISAISQPVALAFQLLSRSDSAVTTIVQEGSVTAIASLLRMSNDIYTLTYAILALCNLLSAEENHLQIVQQGMLATLTTLSTRDDETIRSYCALAIFNLSCSDVSRKHVVNAGGIASIIALSKHYPVTTRRRCAASLCNLSTYEQGMARMVSDGIIPALVELIEVDDLETVRYSCAALCRLCATVENGKLIMESGAVPRIVQGAIDGDTITKQFCAAVLSSLSFYETCRSALCDLGIFSALRSLSALNDDITKQRCLIAFANLSCDDSVHSTMIDQGVVGIISELANSYKETNQIYCAMALCNLGCCAQMRLRIAMEGGMQSLMMISMVRSVDITTKFHCVRAMANLLDDNTVKYMLSEGILGAIANLCKLDDDNVVHLCARLFNQLTTYGKGRDQFVERPATLSAMFTLYGDDSRDVNTRIICARSTSNMVMNSTSRQKAIDYGALEVIESGAKLEVDGASLHCIQAAFAACSNKEFRLKMVSKTVLPVSVCEVAAESSGEKFLYCVKVLCTLAWHEESLRFLVSNDFVNLMIQLISKNPYAVESISVAQTLCYVCLGYRDQGELIDIGILSCLNRLCQTRNEVIMNCTGAILRNLATDEHCTLALANSNSINNLRLIASICKSESALYNIAVTLYMFAKHGAESRYRVLNPDLIQLLSDCTMSQRSAELTAASICSFCIDFKTRNNFANADVAKLMVRIIDYNVAEDSQSNVVSAVYSLSRVPSCRDQLVAAGVDRMLLKLSQGDSAKVKANCSRALKNLSSDASETIEEGAVAALIAMSLEGKNRSKGGEEVELPDVFQLSYKSYGPPSCLGEDIRVEYWRVQSEPIKGGAAGRGPPPPEVPKMSAQSAADILLSSLDDAESTVDSDGKTKMAFAKMLVPSDLRDCFLFTDRDFDVQDDNDSDSLLGLSKNSSDDNLEGPEDSTSRHGSTESQRSPKSGIAQQLSEVDSDGSGAGSTRSQSRRSGKSKSRSSSRRVPESKMSVTSKTTSTGEKKRPKKSRENASHTGGSVGSNTSLESSSIRTSWRPHPSTGDSWSKGPYHGFHPQTPTAAPFIQPSLAPYMPMRGSSTTNSLL